MTKEKKSVIFLAITFIIISIFHVVYSIYVHRCLYMDGSYWFICMLNSIDQNKFNFPYDQGHCRYIINFIQHIPIMAACILFHIKNKFIVSYLYSFTLFSLPLFLLFLNYKLTKRTKQFAIFFWSLFSYCVISLLYQIFSVVETIIGIPVYYILLNYLFAKIKYTKLDEFCIYILLIIMFGIHELTLFMGFVLFAAMFAAILKKDVSEDSFQIKLNIGIGSLLASLYTLYFMFQTKGESSEIMRFIGEGSDFLNRIFQLNAGLSLITLLILLLFVIYFRKGKELKYSQIGLISCIYIYYFYKMFSNPDIYINPVIEGHLRTIPCYIDVLIILGIVIYNFKNLPAHTNFIKKCCIPVLLCGITLTAWQIVNSYYWYKNINFFMHKLSESSETIFVPENNEEISSFFNENLRRYIWHGNYITTALALSKDYKPKTLPVHYITNNETANNSYSYYLYPILKDGLICVPYFEYISIKNRFWDLTDFVNELDNYIKINNIKTDYKQ